LELGTQTFHQVECGVEVEKLYVRITHPEIDIYGIRLQDEVCVIVPYGKMRTKEIYGHKRIPYMIEMVKQRKSKHWKWKRKLKN